MRTRVFLGGALLLALSAGAEAPLVEHQPSPCTVPAQAVSLCAAVTDDGQVAKARIYFRPAGEKFYSFVDMVFEGLKYCGTLPAPRRGKAKALEYYIQAVDDQYDTQRTSTFQLEVQPESVCAFPPLEKDPGRAASIVVYATDKKQGKKLPEAFSSDGVSFVPVPGR